MKDDYATNSCYLNHTIFSYSLKKYILFELGSEKDIACNVAPFAPASVSNGELF